MSKPKQKNKAEDKIADGIEKGSEATGALGGAIAGGAVAGAGALLSGGALTPAIKSGADIGAGLGKDAGKAIGGMGKMAKKAKDGLMGNPLEMFVDKILKLIIDFLIPVPIAGEYIGDFVAKYKGQIIMGLFSFITFIVMFSGGNGGVSGEAGIPVDYEGLPEELKDYVEEGFVDTGTPHHSPFGGKGKANTIITSYFDDPIYYQKYGRWHKGLDLVPNGNYYSNNEAYKIHKDVVFFAICSGNARSEKDGAGANMVIIECEGGKYDVLYAHNKYNFVPNGGKVKIVAGQPIAVMGNTGNSDGAHIHFGIHDNNSNTWIDPYPFISK